MFFFRNIKTFKYFFYVIFRPSKINHLGVKLNLKHEGISDYIINAVYKGFYEYAEAKLLRKFIRPDNTIVEIGGGMGFIAILAAKYAKSVVVYEGNPKLIEIIKENIIINNIHNIKVKSFAVYTDCSQPLVDFYIGDNFWNASFVKFDNAVKKSVRTIGLDEVVEKSVDSLIIDVEGFEFELLHSYIYPYHVKKVLIEFHPKVLKKDEIDRIKNNLTEQGFVFLEKSRDVCYFERLPRL